MKRTGFEGISKMKTEESILDETADSYTTIPKGSFEKVENQPRILKQHLSLTYKQSL